MAGGGVLNTSSDIVQITPRTILSKSRSRSSEQEIWPEHGRGCFGQKCSL